MDTRRPVRRCVPVVLFGVLLAAGCTSPSTPSPVVPTDPPKITCPRPIALTAAGVPVVATYQSPTVAGGTAPISTACSPSSGASFPGGSTIVSCTVTDSKLLADSCSFTVTVTVAVPRISATRFVAFGDSITEGKPGTSSYHRGVSQFPTAYAAVLYNLLVARYSSQDIELYDEGYAGEQVQNGPPPGPGVVRLPHVLIADTPQVLLLQEGANDLNQSGVAGIPSLIDGLRIMIGQARSRSVIVFLGTLLPQRPNGTPTRAFHPEAIAPANVRIRELAASEGVVLVDLYAAFGGSPDPWIDPDGLHPNVAGYRKMAETFFDAIQSRFEIAPASTLMRSPGMPMRSAGRDVWTP